MSKSLAIESSFQEIPGSWLDTPPAVRATRLRLFAAMGVASILLAALLTLDVELSVNLMNSTIRQERLLTVDISKGEKDQRSDFKTDRYAATPRIEDEQPLAESDRAGIAEPRSREASGGTEPVVSASARDWSALAQRIAKETVDDYFRRENTRASMWRQTRSVLFQPGPHVATVREEEPILANLTFREPVGVLGLGFTVGSCFIGIPLAGIPVAERSTAITLFYCRDQERDLRK